MTERRHASDARDATGKLIADYYCPRCDHFSGGGLCRICKRELAIDAQDATSGDDSSTTGDSTLQRSLL